MAVRFVDGDAWLLWCVPRGGCSLADLLRVYGFVARDAYPRYERLARCLAGAVRAGLMRVPSDGRYVLTPEWFERLHRLDDAYAASEYGLMEFEEEFVRQEWPEVTEAAFVLPRERYDAAVAGTEQ